MNAEPSMPSWRSRERELLLEQREDRVHGLAVGVVEEPAEPEQADDEPGIGPAGDGLRTAAGDPRRRPRRIRRSRSSGSPPGRGRHRFAASPWRIHASLNRAYMIVDPCPAVLMGVGHVDRAVPSPG